jgi:glyoxylase-like metal-dependent hydrolase (beta-lactamase superfamily II)
VTPPYGKVEELEPGIARLLAHNPSPFTYTGTQSYVLGEQEVVVIDPGPELDDHVEALIAAIAGRPLKAILCTHTHRDHSPAARMLKDRTGAPIVGCAPLVLESAGPRADASFDPDYRPDRVLEDGTTFEVDGEELVAVATPGHTSNHLCFGYKGALFSGDHVMKWSTTVIFPPDGEMGAYMESLEKLRRRDDRIYYPAHGPAVENPRQYVRQLVGHRMQREKQILSLVRERPRKIVEIVVNAYPGLDPRLAVAAGGSVLAHLLDLRRRGLVKQQQNSWIAV